MNHRFANLNTSWHSIKNNSGVIALPKGHAWIDKGGSAVTRLPDDGYAFDNVSTARIASLFDDECWFERPSVFELQTQAVTEGSRKEYFQLYRGVDGSSGGRASAGFGGKVGGSGDSEADAAQTVEYNSTVGMLASF